MRKVCKRSTLSMSSEVAIILIMVELLVAMDCFFTSGNNWCITKVNGTPRAAFAIWVTGEGCINVGSDDRKGRVVEDTTFIFCCKEVPKDSFLCNDITDGGRFDLST